MPRRGFLMSDCPRRLCATRAVGVRVPRSKDRRPVRRPDPAIALGHAGDQWRSFTAIEGRRRFPLLFSRRTRLSDHPLRGPDNLMAVQAVDFTVEIRERLQTVFLRG